MATKERTVQDYREAVRWLFDSLAEIPERINPCYMAIVFTFNDPEMRLIALDANIMDDPGYANLLHDAIWHKGDVDIETWAALPAEIKRRVAWGCGYCGTNTEGHAKGCDGDCHGYGPGCHRDLDVDRSLSSIFVNAESAQICFEHMVVGDCELVRDDCGYPDIVSATAVLKHDERAWIDTYNPFPTCFDAITSMLQIATSEQDDDDIRFIKALHKHRDRERRLIGQVLCRTFLVARPLAAPERAQESTQVDGDHLSAIAAVARDRWLMRYIAQLTIGIPDAQAP